MQGFLFLPRVAKTLVAYAKGDDLEDAFDDAGSSEQKKDDQQKTQEEKKDPDKKKQDDKDANKKKSVDEKKKQETAGKMRMSPNNPLANNAKLQGALSGAGDMMAKAKAAGFFAKLVAMVKSAVS